MKQTNEEIIKSRIEKKREEARISQEKMADTLGINRSTYRNIEKGPTRILNEHLDEIAGLLTTSVQELVLGWDPEDPGQNPSLREALAENDRQLSRLRSQYEDRIDKLVTEAAAKDARIRELEENRKLLEDLIRFLKDELERLRKND